MAEIELRQDPNTELWSSPIDAIYRVDGDTGPDLTVEIPNLDLTSGSATMRIENQDNGYRRNFTATIVSSDATGSEISFTFGAGDLSEGLWDADFETVDSGSTQRTLPTNRKMVLIVRRASATT
jgi:hypothetical protein